MSETRPLQQATGYTYYPNGLLETVTDAKGQITAYGYDDANRLGAIVYDDDKTDSFDYDDNGNLTSYSKEGVSGAITYDELNRKKTETVNFGAFSKTYSYTYEGFTKKSFTSPEEKTYSYGYDLNDRIKTITYGTDKIIDFTYNKTRLQAVALPNGVTTGYGFEDNGWLAGITAQTSTDTVLSRQYSLYDNVGNVKQITAENGTHTFGYDPTYQLTSAGTPAGSEAYTYDPVGNRQTSSATTGTWGYNGNNELQGFDTTGYQHDANGNTTQKQIGTAVTGYVYNSADRLETVNLPGGGTAVYTYDPFGRRIKKQVGSDITYYLYSDEGLIGEYDAAGNLKKGYGWKPDSTWGTDPLFMTKTFMDENGQPYIKYYFYHNDHLGTPQKMTDEAGTIVWSATYSAFGKATVASTVENNLRFPGQFADDETGLHYNWQRYYDPETGRYTQVDPIGFMGRDFNLFRYVYNRPSRFGDQLGLLFGINAGESYGEIAAEYWANKYNNTDSLAGKFGYGFMGGMASLWTRNTSEATFTTLAAFGGGLTLAAKIPNYFAGISKASIFANTVSGFTSGAAGSLAQSCSKKDAFVNGVAGAAMGIVTSKLKLPLIMQSSISGGSSDFFAQLMTKDPNKDINWGSTIGATFGGAFGAAKGTLLFGRMSEGFAKTMFMGVSSLDSGIFGAIGAKIGE